MKTEITKEQALVRLTALCARGEHCEFEMTEKMRRWGVDEDVQAEVMAYLVAERYVDNARYARFFINDKVKYNRWGRRKVEQALRMKRIDEETYRPLLDEMCDTEEYSELLPQLLRTKMRSVKAKNDYDMRAKLIRFALSRGFQMDDILQALERI